MGQTFAPAMTRAAAQRGRASAATFPARPFGFLQRKCACEGAGTGACEECEAGRGAPTPAQRFGHDFAKLPVHAEASAPLAIGPPGDRFEQEADRIAQHVMRVPEEHTLAGGLPAHRNEHVRERIQAKPVHAPDGAQAAAPAIVGEVLRSPGQPLDGDTRSFFEPRFGHDLSRVRVHTDARAADSAQSVRARAFTVGTNIVFNRGEFSPATADGRQLLAHEFAHVLQQGAGARGIQREPLAKGSTAEEKDPLCATFDYVATKADLSAKVEAHKSAADPDKRNAVIRALKLMRRCATAEQQTQVQDDVAAALGQEAATSLWQEAGTPFGGYTGMYPGYAGDIKRRLTKLGASETLPFGSFGIDYADEGHLGAKRAKAKKVAKDEVADLARTDIVYFRGHQFAQYGAPGVFTDGNMTAGFDLRYVEQVGGFQNVKLMISTSCATLCKEAFELFHGLFPNAVILGFRKSAPVDGGGMRDALEARIKALNRPLLLDQAVDVGAIIAAWRSISEGTFAGSGSYPAYYDGTLHYWDGKAWQDIQATSAANKCFVKGDNTLNFPAPGP
jgi:uncharacterized protein DUF4157